MRAQNRFIFVLVVCTISDAVIISKMDPRQAADKGLQQGTHRMLSLLLEQSTHLFNVQETVSTGEDQLSDLRGQGINLRLFCWAISH